VNQSDGDMSKRSGIRAMSRISSTNNRLPKPLNRNVIFLVLTSFLLLCLGLLVQQNFYSVTEFINRPISKIRIENQWQHVSEEEISALLAEYMDAGFFNFDIAGVKKNLERHPWVQRATIKKLWPESISLHLTEQVAIARWNSLLLLNQNGEVFKPIGTERLISLPLLKGPEQSQIRVMKQYQGISQLLFPSGLRLTGLTLSSRGSWELELNDQLKVTAGRTDVFEKLQLFVEFYVGQPVAQTAGYRSIDLRYENGMAIQSTHQNTAGVAIR